MRTMTKSKNGGRRKGHSVVAGSPEDTVQQHLYAMIDQKRRREGNGV